MENFKLIDFVIKNEQNYVLSVETIDWLKLFVIQYLSDEEANILYNEHYNNHWSLYILGLSEKDLEQQYFYFLSSAYYGNPYAKTVIGFNYFYGNYVKQDLIRAKKWFENSIEFDPDASFGLGQLYEKGLNKKIVLPHYTKLDKGSQFKLAKEQYEYGMSLGSKKCQIALAFLYYNKKGFKIMNINKVRELFKTLNTPEGDYLLGLTYTDRDGIFDPAKKTNKKKAMELFTKSAENNYQKAIDMLNFIKKEEAYHKQIKNY